MIKNPHLDRIISEGAKYKETPHASDVLIESLANIEEIKSELSKK